MFLPPSNSIDAHVWRNVWEAGAVGGGVEDAADVAIAQPAAAGGGEHHAAAARRADRPQRPRERG
jgi:hypothetical protein